MARRRHLVSEDGGTNWKVTRLTKGKMDDLAANDPHFAKMIGWTSEPLPFTDTFRSNLVTRLRPRHAIRWHQTSEPAGQ